MYKCAKTQVEKMYFSCYMMNNDFLHMLALQVGVCSSHPSLFYKFSTITMYNLRNNC